MRPRRTRKDYPKGVLGIYDNGGKTADRYTVVYEPFFVDGRPYFPYVGMSAGPFWPQGFCQHGEAQGYGYPRGNTCGKVIRFEDLPPDCQTVVLRDIDETERFGHDGLNNAAQGRNVL